MKRAIVPLLALLSSISLAPAQEDLLIGITWPESQLVTFDPVQGRILETHLQLDPRRRFRGLAYDRTHHRLYALAQGTQDLYLIDPGTPSVRHLGNLRLDPEYGESFDAGALAYDPGRSRLFAAVERWTAVEGLGIRSELMEVDVDTAAVSRVGTVDGTFITSLGWEEDSGRLLALAVDGPGSWDDARVTRVIELNPDTAEATELQRTPYHTLMGLAFAIPPAFRAWANWEEQFFALVDPGAGTVTRLGPSEEAPILSAMIRRDFPVRSQILPPPPVPAGFQIAGMVESVHDPGGVLRGRIRPGSRFEGRLGFDASAPTRPSDPNGGEAYGLSVSFRPTKFSTRGVQATAWNNRYLGPPQGAVDRFEARGTTRTGVEVSWRLFDPAGLALDDDTFLPDSFDLSDWPENVLTVRGWARRAGGFQPFEIKGRVDRAIPGGGRIGRGKDRQDR